MPKLSPDDFAFVAIMQKALNAGANMPLKHQAALASVLVVMAGAPLHVASDDVVEKALTVVPKLTSFLRRNLKVNPPASLDAIPEIEQNANALDAVHADAGFRKLVAGYVADYAARGNQS